MSLVYGRERVTVRNLNTNVERGRLARRHAAGSRSPTACVVRRCPPSPFGMVTGVTRRKLLPCGRLASWKFPAEMANPGRPPPVALECVGVKTGWWPRPSPRVGVRSVRRLHSNPPRRTWPKFYGRSTRVQVCGRRPALGLQVPILEAHRALLVV